MERILKISCGLYASGVAGLGIQQFVFADINPVILLAAWPAWLHGWHAGAYLTGAALLIAATMLIVGKRRRTIALAIALFFLILLLIFQVPYFLFVSEYAPIHLGLWTNPLKELALSGGAMVLASSFWKAPHTGIDPEAPLRNGLMSVGRLFFSVMLIAFGVDHFYYGDTVATLMPKWFPGRYLWIYAMGIILVSSGVCILVKIRLAQVSLLVGFMLSTWLVLLHIPQAIHMPRVDYGVGTSRVFEVLAFIGTAFALYATHSIRLSAERPDQARGTRSTGTTPLLPA